ncbi:MAG: HprK-related kinase A [Kordiimonadaceae bacterium]|nr:HprK-related kinase A [Kordiimonadaceae bacterium]MBO6570414.1 HprK-related kinase A [Kordiimonadaceae bacterium]MBO6965488.1 HprK-related kinase A [Kordiimonadaceae bacterium]
MHKTVKDLNSTDLNRALKRGSFTLRLGPFSHLIKGPARHLLPHLIGMYPECQASLDPDDVTEIMLRLKAPNVFRRFIRPQISPDPGFHVPAVPLPESMAPLGFEMGLNLSVALKTCRFVTIHAGVVAKNGSAIMMSAASGGGKSTLAAALHSEGYSLFSDEFALLDLDSADVRAYPRPISLKQQSIPIVRELLGADRVSDVISDTPKGDIAYARVAAESLAENNASAPVKLILFPNFQAGAQPLARRLNPAEAIMRLVAASTNYSLLGEPAYKAIVSMVKAAQTFEITYGTTEQSVQLVEQLAGEGPS